MVCPNRHGRRGVRKFGERNQAIQEDINNNSVSKMRVLVTLKLGSIEGISKESFSDEEEQLLKGTPICFIIESNLLWKELSNFLSSRFLERGEKNISLSFD